MDIQKGFLFEDKAEEDSLLVVVPEVVNPEYGMFTWPCAPVLAQYIWHNRVMIKGKRVLEIGAGTALPGIVAAKCGACVILSDATEYPNCMANCRKSVIANGFCEDDFTVIGLSWGQFPPAIFQLPKIDIILGSDCFYDPDDFENILVTVAFILESNKDGVFWSTYQERNSNWSIEYLLAKWNLECWHIPLSSFDADGETVGGHDMSSKHTIQMLEIKRKKSS